jgi:hypothetical protein
MSTKEPLQSATCPESCETGWRSWVCKAKALACKLQKFIDPLCETQDKVLGFDEYALARKWVDARTSKLMTPIYPNTSRELKALLDKWEEGHLTEYKELRKGARGKLVLLNRIGLFFAYATSCPCCLGWRIAAAFVVGIGIGAVVL